MTIRIRRDHILVLALILAIFSSGLGLGWFVFGRDDTEESYYRGVFDFCSLMVVASNRYTDCHAMTAALHESDLYSQTQGTDGWTWPLNE